MMKLLSQLERQQLQGKSVFLRVDFNVAVEGGTITEPFRIEAAKPTIEYLLQSGAKVTLASHIESIKTFGPIRNQITKILGHQLTLLENTRTNPGEKENSEAFAAELAAGHDVYVNDAFAVAHREHASVAAITKLLPSYAGFLIEKETTELAKSLDAPADGKVLVLGGAKISTKLPVIRNFLDKAQYVVVGGALVNNFYKFDGFEIGTSKYNADELKLLEGLDRTKLLIPEDVLVSKGFDGTSEVRVAKASAVASDEAILDIGPESAKRFAEIIGGSEMAIWNGPMGLAEIPSFSRGTRVVAEAVAQSMRSIIGGGDTIGIANKVAPQAKFSYVSTGGGAMLEFLSGKKLPALEALGYYE